MKPVKIPKTVDEYLAGQNQVDRAALELIRSAVAKAIPGAEETISYRMPGVKFHGMVLYYAAFTNHYSIFTSPGYKKAFESELAAFSQTKSAVHFPKGSRIPVALIGRIARFIAKENLKKSEAKKGATRKGILSKSRQV